jgi:uncharacterized coiled-coil protein SlyX
MDLSTLLALVTGIGGLTLSVFSFASMRRMRNAEALAKETESKSLEDTITERVLKRADSEIAAQAKHIDELKAALMVEQAARNSDKAQHEARHDSLRMELQAEREAREKELLEHDREINAVRAELNTERSARGALQQRIGVLETELAKRDQRIKELEALGTFKSSTHGFKAQ